MHCCNKNLGGKCHVFNGPMEMTFCCQNNFYLFICLEVEYDQDVFLTASVRCTLSLIAAASVLNAKQTGDDLRY